MDAHNDEITRTNEHTIDRESICSVGRIRGRWMQTADEDWAGKKAVPLLIFFCFFFFSANFCLLSSWWDDGALLRRRPTAEREISSCWSPLCSHFLCADSHSDRSSTHQVQLSIDQTHHRRSCCISVARSIIHDEFLINGLHYVDMIVDFNGRNMSLPRESAAESIPQALCVREGFFYRRNGSKWKVVVFMI